MPILPSLPSPHTWPTEQAVQAPTLRSDVSNAVQFFTTPPAFMGSQLGSSQVITSTAGTMVGVFIDAEYLDEWNGHRQNSNGGNYYAPVPGMYLCQSGIAFPSDSTGQVSAGIQYESGGGSLTFVGGQRLPSRGGSVANQPGAAFLVSQTNILGWGSGDFTGPAGWQNSGSSVTLLNTATQSPWFSARLVGQFGTSGLSVPANPSFTSPLTSAFMNANIRDAISFLTEPPVFEGIYTTGSATLASQTTLPATGSSVFGFNDVFVDNYSAYSSGTGLWAAPVAGVYFIYGCVSLTQGAGGQAMAAGLTITSALQNGGSTFTFWGGTQGVTASAINSAIIRRRMRLNAGDTIGLSGFQRDSGAATALINGAFPWTTVFLTVWECA